MIMKLKHSDIILYSEYYNFSEYITEDDLLFMKKRNRKEG